MKYKIYSCIVLTVAFFAMQCMCYAQMNSSSFVWGLNGHPVTQQNYRDSSWADQIHFLKDLQINYYRVDVPLKKESGIATSDASFLKLLNVLRGHEINTMPVVFPKDLDSNDSLTAYQSYFEQGKVFAERYGRFVNVLEVGNELDLKLMVKNKTYDGTKAYHYNLSAARRKMWLLAGFIDGLKSVKPTLKVSLSLTWTHFYYLDLLKQYNINYDIVGYHWYSNMGDITKVRAPYDDILYKIKRKYSKEIWITEFNTHVGTKRNSFDDQDIYIRQSLGNILKQGIVTGFFIYELFDQAALKNKYPNEADFGIVYRDKGVFKQKPVYFTLKKIIQKAKSSN